MPTNVEKLIPVRIISRHSVTYIQHTLITEKQLDEVRELYAKEDDTAVAKLVEKFVNFNVPPTNRESDHDDEIHVLDSPLSETVIESLP